jgi:hypothetical protein
MINNLATKAVIYAEGNNREAIKFKRISIPIDIPANVSFYGRYYLPEFPEIDKGIVVGIQYNNTTSYIFPSQQWSQLDTVNTEIIRPYPIFNIPQGIAQNCSLNLVNSENYIIIENFPLQQLLSGQINNISSSNKLKIIPFDCKIKTKHSYISCFQNTVLPNDASFVINLTFFYRDTE